MLQDETSHEQQAKGSLCIRYYPIADQLERLGERFWDDFDEFVRLARMFAGAQLGCPKQVNPLVGEARCCPYSSKTLEAPRCHTDLLEQLPSRAHIRVFARIQAPCRDLEQRSIRGVPVLLDEQDRRIVATRI